MPYEEPCMEVVLTASGDVATAPIDLISTSGPDNDSRADF